MYFVGLDLAWGEKNQTGVAAIDSDGRLLHVGAAQDDASIIDAVAPFTGDECLVAIDAPLIVNNPTGHRPSETSLNRDFHRFEAGARPAFTDKPEFKNPRGARLAAALDLDMDPASNASRRAIEVYPHPATVVLFELEKTLKYKKGAFEDRKRDLLELMTRIEGLDKATPRLRVNHNMALGGVAETGWRRRSAGTTRPRRGSRRRCALRIRCVVLVSPARRCDNLRRLRDGIHRHAEPSTRSRVYTSPTGSAAAH